MWHISLFDMFTEILVLNFDKGSLLSTTALRVFKASNRFCKAAITALLLTGAYLT